MAMENLVSTYRGQGRDAEAARVYEEVLEKSRRIMGEEHPQTLVTMHNLALTCREQGRNAEAVRMLLNSEPEPSVNWKCLESYFWSFAQSKFTFILRIEEYRIF